jgi:competence protein ComEA
MEFFKKIILICLLALPCYLLAADKVNINTADKETLMTEITGVGEKRAEAIIAWREQHGPFKSVDDLAIVSGVGQAIVDKNRDSLTVGE